MNTVQYDMIIIEITWWWNALALPRVTQASLVQSGDSLNDWFSAWLHGDVSVAEAWP